MVAGEVEAKDTPLDNVAGFPTEKEMAAKVLPLPELNRGKYLVSGEDDIGPCMEEGKVVRLTIEHGKFQFLKRSDVFSIVTTDGSAFAGGAHILEETSILGKHRIVLRNKDEQPVSVRWQGDKEILDFSTDIEGAYFGVRLPLLLKKF